MAGITYRDGGTNRTIRAVTYQDGATKRTIRNVWYGDGVTKRQVFAAYTPIGGVTATPSSVTQTDSLVEPAPSTKTVTSSPDVITWSGGNAASVSWSLVSGDTMTVSGTSSATFSATVSKNSSKNAIYRATVSDGTSSGTVDVTVTLEYTTTA